MPSIKRIHHVALLVEDVETALSFWRDALGLPVAHRQEIPEQQATTAFLTAGEAEIELVRPTSPDGGMGRLLAKRGPGMHHVCLEVDDLDGCLERLRQRNIRLITPEPVSSSGGRHVIFIHPESTQGVLVELYGSSAS